MKEIGLFPIFSYTKKAVMGDHVCMSSVDMIPWDKFPEAGTVELRSKYICKFDQYGQTAFIARQLAFSSLMIKVPVSAKFHSIFSIF